MRRSICSNEEREASNRLNRAKRSNREIAADLRPIDLLRAGRLRSGKAAPTGESLFSAFFKIVLRTPTLRAGSQFRNPQFEIRNLPSAL